VKLLLSFALIFFFAVCPAQSPVPYNPEPPYKKVEIRSLYLEMRDGVKIAVDVYLPKGLTPDEKLPTILYQTRYWRRINFRWPASMFTGKFPLPELKEYEKFVCHGYAVVNYDVRGSGASFGHRIHPWSPAEIGDGAEVVDWISEQPWSNGKVGATGISYSATSAELLLVNQHPDVLAIAPRFSLFDLYEDVAYPGGIKLEWFINEWGEINRKLDSNKVPLNNIVLKLFVAGVAPVEGRKKLLPQAIREHKQNISPRELTSDFVFHDDTIRVKDHIIPTIDIFSPHHYIDQINATGVPVYCYTSWFDAAYQHGTIRRFLNLENKKKLIIGPWEHGGLIDQSPENPGKASFDHFGELLKFFDHHLRGINNGIDEEPGVYYYTMVEEKWKSAATWPISQSNLRSYFLDEKNTLIPDMPSGSAQDVYRADTTAGTGKRTRWNALIREKHKRIYRNRREKDKKLLVYETSELKSATEVTGHPQVDFFLKSNRPDIAMFVYLEDVDERGNVTYVTEGEFRLRHREISKNPVYEDVVPFHSYLRKDDTPLDTGKVAEIKFDLYPTSYLFLRGHKIRISIGLADKDYFKGITPSDTEIQLQRGENFPSSVKLPIVE